MMWQMLKHGLASFTAPFRPRPPPPDRSDGLLRPQEKDALAATNRHIARTAERLKQEIALMAREHRRE